MSPLLSGIIGIFAGLHSSCWGAYKDSLYEKFEWAKFFRSIAVGFILGVILSFFLERNSMGIVNPGIFFVFVIVFERLFTEALKAFVRDEHQAKYKIPSKFHIFGKIVENRALRLLAGALYLCAAVALFYLPAFVGIQFSSNLIAGAFWGGLAGLFGSAVGWAWKDAPIEGLHLIKFFPSLNIKPMSWNTIIP